MTWNTNITEALTGDYVWLATKCGRVTKGYWSKNTFGKGRGCWFPFWVDPIAWHPFIKPIHPFELAKQEESAS